MKLNILKSFLASLLCIVFLQAESNKTTVINNLRTDLGVIFDSVLEVDSLKTEDQVLAERIKTRLDNKYANILQEEDISLLSKKVWMLQCLVDMQKRANAKLEIFLAAKDEILNFFELQGVKLKIFNEFLDQIQKRWNDLLKDNIDSSGLSQKFINNGFVTDCVKKWIAQKIDSSVEGLLWIDFYGLFPSLCKRYIELMDEFRNSKQENFVACSSIIKLDSLLKDLEKQKDILFEVDWDAKFQVSRVGDDNIMFEQVNNSFYRKEVKKQLKKSSDIFDLFCNKLIRIKKEVEKSKKFWLKLQDLDSNKKSLMVKYHILFQDEDYQTFGSLDDLFDCFHQFERLVEEYLSREIVDADQFIYKITSILESLKKLQSTNGITSELLAGKIEIAHNFMLFGWGAKDSTRQAQKAKLGYVLNLIIDILQDVRCAVQGEEMESKGFFKQVIKGEIPIPEKVKDWALIAVQGFLNR
jgi:hypothetical protein